MNFLSLYRRQDMQVLYTFLNTFPWILGHIMFNKIEIQTRHFGSSKNLLKINAAAAHGKNGLMRGIQIFHVP